MRTWLGKVICVALMAGAVMIANVASAEDVGADWVARYDRATLNDKAVAVAVDSSGNVYVTGGAIDVLTAEDYVTIKYDASGDEVWVKHYDGPASGTDTAKAIAVDGSGNVYVTGGSPSLNPPRFSTWSEQSAGGTYDEVTFPPVLDPDGTVLDYWTITFTDSQNFDCAGGTSGSVGSGNINSDFSPMNGSHPYFTIDWQGWGGTWAVDDQITFWTHPAAESSDYATVKYNAMGNELWVARYNGTASGADTANAIAIDGAGNVYVTGQSVGTGTGYDFATVCYNASGIEQWASRHNGSGNIVDVANGLAVDGGYVYVIGEDYDTVTGYDMVTIQYDASTGVQGWLARYNNSGNSSEAGAAIAVDGPGVYVTGNTGSAPNRDYVTIKYSTIDGSQAWALTYDGPDNTDDLAFDIAVDGSGSAYVTGESFGIGTLRDYATIRYRTSDGFEHWVARYNNDLTNGADAARAIAVEGGKVYVTGASVGSFSNLDYATVKYDATTGTKDWAVRYNGPGNAWDAGRDIAVDSTGVVYVTGESLSGFSGYDCATVKYVTGLTVPLAECSLECADPDVSPGETLNFYATVTNNTAQAGTIYFATKVQLPLGGFYPPSGYLKIFPLQMGSYQSKEGPLTQDIPLGVASGAYTYIGHVGLPGQLWHECSFVFNVQ